MKTKKCARCKKVKQVINFNKHNKNADKLQSWCKECMKAYEREKLIELIDDTVIYRDYEGEYSDDKLDLCDLLKGDY